jgi:hypothetical protein
MMESTDVFISEHFDAAMRIHCLCYDQGVSDADTRLFTYIYVKSRQSPEGLECFDGDCSIEIEAIEALLGKHNPVTVTTFTGPMTAEDMKDIVADMASHGLERVERNARRKHGIESPIRPELLCRLRFHRDPAFRKEKLAFYRSHIAPQIDGYSQEQVDESCQRLRDDLQRRDSDLEAMLR